MRQIRNSKKKKMMSFSFCFPYLASMQNLPLQKIRKQKISLKFSRSETKKKRPDTATSRYSLEGKKKKISNFEIDLKKRGQSIDLAKRQNHQTFSKIQEKISNTTKISKTFKRFKMPDMPQFDFNEIVNRKTKVKKQEEKIIDYDNFSTVLSKNFEIPGISFKKTQPDLMKQRYSSIQSTGYQNSLMTDPKVSDQNMMRKSTSKWTEQRMLNIQFIIKNKCKDFQGTMAQYYQRTQNQKASFIFVFDSKDLWMKRVLLNRGWTENKNKLSKAFHLLWTYKFPKDATFFPEQLINHYRYSLKLTTKIGLYSLLKKYNLSHLQPKTFDLDKQKDVFMAQYDRLSFISDLKEIDQTFNFKQSQEEIQQQQSLRQKIEKMLKLQVKNPEQQFIQRQLKYFLQKCLQILAQTQKFTYKSFAFQQLLIILKQKQTFQKHNYQIVSLLKRFLQLIEKFGTIPNLKQGGYNNIWIIKSNCSSKGAGMFLSQDCNTISRQGNRLAQKYIENVLILQGFKKRKFDLRIWVLVVGGKNCRIYYNQKFYGRLCFQTYNLSEKSLKNNGVHLTNYTVNRPSYNEVKQKPVSVVFPEQLFTQIQKEYKVSYKPIFYEKVEQLLYQMQEIFEKQICIGANQNTFQLFGMDLLLDYKLDLHLLQINLSAQCEERHQNLSKMLQQMGQGLLNILEGKENITTWRLIQ